MNKLSFYEQAGILIPGVIFLSGILFLVPEARTSLSDANISIGEFGLVLIISYALGHAVAAAGNLLEKVWWDIRGGMPSNWVLRSPNPILNAAQIERLQQLVKERFGIDAGSISNMSDAEWRPIFGQVYRCALSLPNRIEVFNGNYGLNRGLAAALLLLAIVATAIPPHDYLLATALLVGFCIYLYRMNRFGVHFAREVYFAFLNYKPPLTS